jgi:putative PIN family toxin of toxin-antitoxin system
MIDTNVLLSALVFGSKRMAHLIEKVAEEHTMVLCSYIIDEFRDVVTRKSPKYSHVVDELFAKLTFEMAYTPKWNENMPDIRDEKDKPILAAAIVADVDIIVSGDEDFFGVDMERPEILSPAKLLDRL